MSEEPSLLQQFLLDRDHACPACHYNLRNLNGAVCPECGEALHLQVGVDEPSHLAAIFAVIGLASGAGFDLLLIGYLAIQYLKGISYQFSHVLKYILPGIITEGVALLILLHYWRRVRKLKRSSKVMLVVCAWGLTLANLIYFSLNIR